MPLVWEGSVMTTTTDTLTRWLPLWEQDEGLRPTFRAFNGTDAFEPCCLTMRHDGGWIKVGSTRLRRQEAAAWSYMTPDDGYKPIEGRFAFYAGVVDACYVGDERVVPQARDYYGGWVTANIAGPFKGDPGTERW